MSATTSTDTNKALNRAEFDAAVQTASEAAQSYYDTDVMAMPDADYDALVERIESAKEAHPDWDDAGLTTAVAGGASAGGDVVHPEPMLSLSKTKTFEEIEKFVESVSANIVVEAKLDGLAIRAEYKDGNLVLAATRGDGRTGEDVTAQATRHNGIDGLPATLTETWTGEVRGEVFMSDANFEIANTNRVADGGKAFVNPRNATAGCLRKADRDYETPMSFGAYDITGDTVDDNGSYIERMFFAANLGFETAISLTPMNLVNDPTLEPADVIGRIQWIEDARDTLGYPIDGAVIKAEFDADRERLGNGNRTPRWATSFKYAPDTATTVLTGIEVSVGRTGRITLRAVLEPVFVGGTTISFATLHHPGFVASEGLAIGQTVAVIRAGDVIPRVTAAMGEQPAGLEAWVAPEACPQCGEAWDKSSVLWRCHTPECSIAGRIEWFGGRTAMDIDGLSTATAEALTESGLVTNIADLYDLTVAQIAAVKIGVSPSGADRLIGFAVATTIFDGIEKSRSQPLNRVIASLGLRFTGNTFGRRFAAHFKTLQAFRDASLADLQRVDAVREGRGTLIHAGLVSLRPVIDRLIAAGVTTEIEQIVGDTPLAGQSYVVSGSVPGYTRQSIAEAIERLGGKASSSVSKTTTALVTDDPSTSKGQKALALNIPIMDPADFLALIDGAA